MPPDSPGAGGGSGGGMHGSGGRAGSGPGHTASPGPLPPPASSFAPGSICEADGWCWYNPLPSGSSWTAVAGAGRSDLWIGGFSPNLLRFAGGRWSLVPSPLSVRNIWAASTDDVWFVGSRSNDDTTGVIAHWDGAVVAEIGTFGSDSLEGVWGASASDVYAVGFATLQHWDGVAWTPIPGVSGIDVSGTGPNDVWVGGLDGLFHFDGSGWSRVAGFESQLVLHLTAGAPDDVWAVTLRNGDQTIEHFDGSRWSVSFDLLFAAAPGLTDIHAAPGQGVWLVGGGYVNHFDGSVWTRAPGAESKAFGSVRSTQGFGVVAVGGDGNVVRLAADPAPRVIDVSVGRSETLRATFGTSPRDMWAVGDGGTVLHYDGRAVVPVPSGTTASLRDVWGTSPDDVWAVGVAGTVVHYDGRAFTPVSSGTNVDLHAVFTAGPGDVWIAGDGATLKHWGGTGFERAVVPGIAADVPIRDLHGLASHDVWLAAGAFVGTGGIVSHFDGSAWSPVEVLTFAPPKASGPLLRIWELAPNDVWALTDATMLGDRRGFWHFDGVTWTETFLADSPATFMFPARSSTGTFVFGPHDRWRTGGGGVWQRSTQ